MQVTKWIRKNRQAIMVVVVIMLMIVFVGDYGLQQFLMYFGHGTKQSIAKYDDGKKITNQDMAAASQELEILKSIAADRMLFSKQSMMGMPDINAQLLGYVLFGDTQIGGKLRTQLLGYAQYGQLPIASDEIDNFFGRDPEQREMIWLLLNAETRKTGIAVSNAQAADYLQQLRGSFYAQLYGQQVPVDFIHNIAMSMNLTDDQVLTCFGKLLAILKWSELLCDNQNVTLAQIRSSVGRSSELIDADYVKFPAEWYIDKTAEQTGDALASQFNQYKDMVAGDISDSNPYGFGYKLPQRIQLDYFVVKTTDLATIVEKPTPEAMEDYYSSHIAQFQSQETPDPNKPDQKVTKTKSFVEARSEIHQTIEKERIDKFKQLIFKEAKDALDADISKLNPEKVTSEELQKVAGNFETVAAKLSEKYKIPILTGKTGYLSRADFSNDQSLSGLKAQNASTNYNLLEAAFAAVTKPEAKYRRLGSFIPLVWETIGPLNGGYYSEADRKYTDISALCRVTDLKNQETPASIDTTYSIAGVVYDKNQPQTPVFELKKQVKEDLQKLSGMAAAKTKAQEFEKMVADTSWDKALDQFNAKYAAKDPNLIKPDGFVKLDMQKSSDQIVASKSEIEMLRRVLQEDPSASGYLAKRISDTILAGKFNDLLKGQSQTGTIFEQVEFTPDMTYYVVKNVVRKPAKEDDYLKYKPYAALRTNISDSAGLGLIHFNTDNIKTRMNFQWLQNKTNTDTNKEQE